MLVLSRKKDEVIRIGDNVTVKVIDTRHDKVRIGIDAPEEVVIHRGEVYDLIAKDAMRDPMTEVAGKLAVLAKRVAAKRINPDELASCLHVLGVTVEQLGKAVA